MKNLQSLASRFSWLLFSLLIVFFAVSTATAKVIDIKISTIHMQQQQMGQFILDFAKAVKETPELKDKVRVRAYPGAQLYSGKEELEAVSRGELEMAFAIGSKAETLDPAFAVLNLPFLFPNLDSAFKVLNGQIGHQYLWSKLEKDHIQFLGIVFAGTPLISNSKHPILWPDDFKGLKMRSYGRIAKSTLEALGATCIVTAGEETFGALQQGMIDGLITPNAVYLARKYYSIQKYVTDTRLLNLSSGHLFANLDFWNSLPSDVRSKMESILADLLKKCNDDYIAKDRELFQKIESLGNKVDRLTDEQVAAWEKATEKIYEEYGADIGLDVIQNIKAAIAAK